MALPSLDFPDPILTANVYCEGSLDQLIWGTLAPLWARHQAVGEHRGSFLWFARYRRGGEHLKIRFHGSPAAREAFQPVLAADIQSFLDHLPGEAATDDRDCQPGQFPVDPEDQCTTAYPDRSLLWTSYQRQPGIMGRQPMSDDLLHTPLFTRCLGYGSDIILKSCRPDSQGGLVSDARRLSLALKLFVAAWSSLDLPSAKKVEVFRYHRDWLLTSFNLDVTQICAALDRRLQSRPETLAGLRALLDTGGEPEPESAADDDSFGLWQSCFAELFHYTVQRANDPDFLQDSFLKDQVLATVFKLLHAHTNQLATGLLNESYLCQLLIRAGEESWPDTAANGGFDEAPA